MVGADHPERLVVVDDQHRVVWVVDTVPVPGAAGLDRTTAAGAGAGGATGGWAVEVVENNSVVVAVRVAEVVVATAAAVAEADTAGGQTVGAESSAGPVKAHQTIVA